MRHEIIARESTMKECIVHGSVSAVTICLIKYTLFYKYLKVFELVFRDVGFKEMFILCPFASSPFLLYSPKKYLPPVLILLQNQVSSSHCSPR
jgi:hypothetical protein